MDTNRLLNTGIFMGITESEISAMLSCLRAKERSYEKGEFLHRAGDQIHTLGILLSGRISIESDDFWGNKTILSMITPGQVFAETYACLPVSQLMVNVMAITRSEVLFLDMSHLLQPCDNNCAFHNKLIRNLLTISAGKNLELSRRSFHTSARTIRDRLLSYLSYEAQKHGSYEFDISFNRQQLADYLNVDRSALSNELSKMAKEGILSTDHSHFTLVKADIRNPLRYDVPYPKI